MDSEEFAIDELQDVDLSFDGVGRNVKIRKEGGLVQMAHTFEVSGAVETVKKMNQMVRHNGVNRKAETRVRAILHPGMLQEIANRNGITVQQLMSKEYEDLLWREGTGRDYSQMRVVE